MLVIPKHINAKGLFPFLELLAQHRDSNDLKIDFCQLGRITPAGLVAFAAFIAYRKRKKCATEFLNLASCQIRDYLSRMNLLRLCECEIKEDFQRHDSIGRFIPIEEINSQADDLGLKFAPCIAPGGQDYEHENADLYDTANYQISEITNNVAQHSKGKGFIAAQNTKLDGNVRIAIADCGIGIPSALKSFLTDLPADISDEQLIEKAMMPLVSSKGKPSNEGVGLTLSARLVEIMGGSMLVASSGGYVIPDRHRKVNSHKFSNKCCLAGTLVAITFPKMDAKGFSEKLNKAKEMENLLRVTKSNISFQQ